MAYCFDGAKLKIERAKKHINDLERSMKRFAESSPYTIVVNRDSETGCNFIDVQAIKSMPEEFALIIGDALHNLRSALDYVINDIEFALWGERFKHTKFPCIHESRESFMGAVNALKEKSCEEVVSYIENVIQPYRGGNGDAIWRLNMIELDNKHRLLIPKVNVTSVTGIRAEDDTGEEFVLPEFILAEDYSEIAEVFGGKLHIKDKGKASLSILFSDGVFGGESVVPTLYNLVEVVSSTVKGVEAAFYTVFP